MDSEARDIIERAQRYTATRWGHSRYEAWHKCEMSHYLRYHRHVRPLVNDLALDIGSATHVGLAAAMLGDKLGRKDCLQLCEHAVRSDQKLQEEARLEAWRILQHYVDFWGDTAWNFGGDVVAVEELFEADIVGDSGKVSASMFPPTSTRVDAVVRIPWARAGHPQMTWAWVDHKTRKNSPPGVTIPETRAEFVRGLYTDDQFLRHSYCFWRRTGKIRPGVINFLMKTKTPKFERITICHTEEQLKRWATNEDRRIRAYSFELEHQTEPIMQYGECDPQIGMRCWAFDWCHGTESMRAEKFKEGRDG